MKIKRCITVVMTGLLLSSCVSKKVYQDLESKYNRLRTANTTLAEEKSSLLSDKKVLEDQYLTLKKKQDSLFTAHKSLENTYTALKRNFDTLEASYKALKSKSSKELTEQARKNEDLLLQLEEKERNLFLESEQLKALEFKLAGQQAKIDELQLLINAKDAQMQQLKNSISKALHNFEGKGLTVEHKNGKIYVSMENKLLFNSGSWAVGKEGEKAVVQLADVLAENKEIQVLIEGHTDNVPYKGNTLKDNWDLSVKRATAIVRILYGRGVNPTQITAAGRSKFIPIASNDTAEGKAKNRRIEIILAPNLDEISKLLTK